mgnify:CR=1 FL=1
MIMYNNVLFDVKILIKKYCINANAFCVHVMSVQIMSDKVLWAQWLEDNLTFGYMWHVVLRKTRMLIGTRVNIQYRGEENSLIYQTSQY